jgi:hypothetical protein
VNKPDFLVELHELRHIRLGPWMLIGDFNLIYRAKDKNNTRLNQRLMGQFRRFLNKVNLQEVHLNGRSRGVTSVHIQYRKESTRCLSLMRGTLYT